MTVASGLAAKAPKRDPIAFISFFGIALPIMAIVFESVAGLCRGMFFDPMPTLFHTAMFATIPLANARLVYALSRNEAQLPAPWAWLHVFSLGVGIFYSLVFLPLMPFAVLGVILFGLGLLGLAPLFSVISGLRARWAIEQRTLRKQVKLRYGLGLALVAFIAIDMPATVTAIGVRMATESAPDARLRGIKLLRAVGNEDVLLRFCYGKSGRSTDMVGFLLDLKRSVQPEQVRPIFYQVTGEACNSRPSPVKARPRSPFDMDFDRADFFDNEQGGEVVGGRAPGVTLDSSRMDGSVDAHAALGYIEWTMEFHNASQAAQEGRAEIALPPGAVVSRATLWINGEEREAAFVGRSQVRAAYESVVKQRRDPLLVTTAGADRVLVQLFPIQPGSDMKIRIGISAPMTASGPNGVHLQLPSFSERNFELAPTLRHAVWFESSTPLAGSAGLKAETGPGGLSAVRGMLAEPAPGQPVSAIEAPGVMPAALAWSVDDKNRDGKVIVQTRRMVPVEAPGRVALVIDGSRSMREMQGQLLEALAAFPPNVELALVFAGDEDAPLFLHNRADSLPTRRYLQGLEFTGGRDSSAALAAAWDWAGQARGAVVWIHGPQPVLLNETDHLGQRFARRAGQVTLYDLAAVAGPNALAKQFDGIDGVTRVARHRTLAADLQRLFAQWAPGATRVVVARERRAAGGLEVAAKTSSHLGRLWAAGHVEKLGADGFEPGRAVALAMRYQLVTPVSGAVVLESAEQYEAAGLEPVAPGSVPTIPEPETWLLIIVVLLALLWHRRYRHNDRSKPSAA